MELLWGSLGLCAIGATLFMSMVTTREGYVVGPAKFTSNLGVTGEVPKNWFFGIST